MLDMVSRAREEAEVAMRVARLRGGGVVEEEEGHGVSSEGWGWADGADGWGWGWCGGRDMVFFWLIGGWCRC